MYAQGNIIHKIILKVFIIVGNYVHITYKAIAESFRGRRIWGNEMFGEIQQWHSRALNMRKLTMWTFAVKFVFAKYGEKFINGMKVKGGVK